MMLRRILHALPFCLSLVSGVAAAQSPVDSARRAVDKLFAEIKPDGPGCAAAASLNGNVILEKAVGLANLEFGARITPETVFPVASISKQFTAMAVLLLEKDGKLSLDDEVRKYVPELHDYGVPITIRHLLTHTSGLRDHFELIRIARGRLLDSRVTESDALDMIFQGRELNHAPGADWYYSASGYTLAGLIVERVSGRSLRDFAQQRIFTPLGMTRTQFQDDFTMVLKDRAIGYLPAADGSWRWRVNNFDVVGPTGLLSTVGDLLKWEANFETPIVGDSAIVRRMMTNSRLTSGELTGYGLGLFIEQYRGTPFITHGGDEAVYHAALGRFPDHRLAVAVLCNSSRSDPGEVLDQIADAVLANKLAPPDAPPAAAATLTRIQLSGYAGLYANQYGSPITIAMRGDTLVYGSANGAPMVPIGERRFRRTDSSQELEFKTDGNLVITSPFFPFVRPYTRQTRATPTREQLAQYTGWFYSDELKVTYRVSANDNTLTMQLQLFGSGPRTLRPVYGDYFDGTDQVSFTRDSSGAVNAMLMHNIRLRNLRFRRVPNPAP